MEMIFANQKRMKKFCDFCFSSVYIINRMTIVNVKSNLNSYLDIDINYFVNEKLWPDLIENLCYYFFLSVINNIEL